jgi:hypothetical protein
METIWKHNVRGKWEGRPTVFQSGLRAAFPPSFQKNDFNMIGKGVVLESKTHERPPSIVPIPIQILFAHIPFTFRTPKIFSSKGGQKFLLENFSQKFPTLDLKQNF